MRKLILLILLVSVQHIALMAETYTLDLTKSLEIAKEKSFSIQKLSEELKIADYNLKAATSSMKTHIDLNFDGPRFSRSVADFRTDSTISYYSDKSLYYKGNLSIYQPLPTAGRISINSGMANGNSYYQNYRRPTIYTFFNLEQPLNALYGYNEVKSRLKMAKLSYESSKKRFKRRELDLIYEVSSAFYRSISVQKSAEIARLNLERQKEAYDIAKKKYEAGLIKEVDALQMEVDLAEAQNNFDMALIDQHSTMNVFKDLIGIRMNDSIVLSTEFNYETVIVDPEKAVKLALESRPEIREQEIQTEQNKLNVKQQKSNGMIQSSLNLSIGKEGIGMDGKRPISINSSISSAFEKTYTDFTNRDPSYGIGISVKVPILDCGENRAKVRAAEANLKQSLLSQDETRRAIEREVRNLVADLNSSLKRLQLLEKNVVVAEKSFEISRQRFSDGDIDSQALALERNRLNTAYTSHLSAYSTYQLKLADLTRKTFYDFKNNMPIK